MKFGTIITNDKVFHLWANGFTMKAKVKRKVVYQVEMSDNLFDYENKSAFIEMIFREESY